MRVLYISDSDHDYGAPRSMLDFIEELSSRSDVQIIVGTSTSGKVNEVLNDLGIKNFVYGKTSYFSARFKSGKPFSYLVYPILKLRAKYLNRKAIKKIDYSVNGAVDIVHTNISMNNIGAEFARYKNIPHVWHLREAKKHIENYLYLYGNQVSYMNKNSSKFIAISDYVSNYWIKRGLDSNKIVRLYNGIKFNNSKIIRNSKKNREFRMVCVGRIDPEKHQDTIIRSISKLDMETIANIHLDFIGSGNDDYKNFLLKIIDETNLNKTISLLGKRSNVPELLSRYDLAINASPEEALGRVTIEYLWAGVPVIVPSTGASKEIIHEGFDGFIFKKNDSDDLKNKILAFLGGMYNSSIDTFESRKRIREQFSIKKYVFNLMNIYSSLIRKRKEMK